MNKSQDASCWCHPSAAPRTGSLSILKPLKPLLDDVFLRIHRNLARCITPFISPPCASPPAVPGGKKKKKLSSTRQALALIFSRRCLLMAIDLAMAYLFSPHRDLRSLLALGLDLLRLLLVALAHLLLSHQHQKEMEKGNAFCSVMRR